MKFISGDTYRQEVLKLVKHSKALQVAVAFWGKGFEEPFADHGGDMQLICNLESGATNPEVIKGLMAKTPVHTNPRLHAKVLIGDGAVIIGSANLSANGLGLEGNELGRWEEAGAVIRDKDIIQSARLWFDELLNSDDTKEIGKAEIAAAKKRWELLRRIRPGLSAKLDILELMEKQPSTLRNRQIYFAIWHEESSKAADKEFKKISDSSGLKNLSYYEDWPGLPNSGDIIEILWDPKTREKPDYQGCFHRLPQFDTGFGDGRKGGTLQIVEKRCEHRFKINKGKLNAWLKAHIDRLWKEGKGDDTARYISIDEVMDKIVEG